MKLRHYVELDGIRAIAALMVMFFHFFKVIEGDSSILLIVKKISIFGQTGVSLFFVLSGFLITRILINTKNESGYFKNFYVRRFLRIFPLYYLGLVIYYFVLPFFQDKHFVDFKLQSWYWVYLQNVAITFNIPSQGPEHFWSLAVEEHFYSFWPVIVFFLNIKSLKRIILLIIILSLFTRVYLVQHGFETFYFTFSRLDELALGSFLAIIEFEGKLIPRNINKYILLLVISAAPIFAIFALSSGKGIGVIQIIKYNLLAVCYFSIIAIAILLKKSSVIKEWLSTKLFSFTGKISYGLYVYHPFCYSLIIPHLSGRMPVILSVFLCFSATFLVSIMSYYLFEIKFLRLKKYFSYSKQ